jgi:hypothetical protein
MTDREREDFEAAVKRASGLEYLSPYDAMLHGWLAGRSALATEAQPPADTVTLGREEYEAVLSAGEALIARWDSPLWKDLPHTAEYIEDLREAITAARTGKDE